MRQPMTTPQTTGIVPVVAMNTLRVALRDRTVLWLALLFLAMVVLSAYLGWSATNTVNHIYTQALPMLRAYLGGDAWYESADWRDAGKLPVGIRRAPAAK
mgnify:CR=1 FL=1